MDRDRSQDSLLATSSNPARRSLSSIQHNYAVKPIVEEGPHGATVIELHQQQQQQQQQLQANKVPSTRSTADSAHENLLATAHNICPPVQDS
jgi:hypothetical protein